MARPTRYAQTMKTVSVKLRHDQIEWLAGNKSELIRYAIDQMMEAKMDATYKLHAMSDDEIYSRYIGDDCSYAELASCDADEIRHSIPEEYLAECPDVDYVVSAVMRVVNPE